MYARQRDWIRFFHGMRLRRAAHLIRLRRKHAGVKVDVACARLPGGAMVFLPPGSGGRLCRQGNAEAHASACPLHDFRMGSRAIRKMCRRREADLPDGIILESVITCPSCGHAETGTMPTDACQYFYDCKGCGAVLKPKAGDCCVYCSYGTVRCPPIQLGNCVHSQERR